jgi:regulator of protease activity HflC (stomatin/prohibitin superfamily)
MNLQIRLGAWLIVIAAIAIVVMSSYFTVRPNEIAVVTTFGRIAFVAQPGFNLKVPFVQAVRYFPGDVQSLQPRTLANTYTVDNQEVDVQFAVFYRLPVARIEFIYTNALDYQNLLLSMATDRMKAEMGKVNVNNVPEQRGRIVAGVKELLARDSAILGVEVLDFQLVDMKYNDAYRAAITQAANQKAAIEQREYERQQAQKQAETAAIQAMGTANAARERARGDADARVLQATAEARAIQLQGEAQAAAIRAQSQALADNPSYVALRQAERWNGQLPTWFGGGASPLPLLNLTPPPAAAAAR